MLKCRMNHQRITNLVRPYTPRNIVTSYEKKKKIPKPKRSPKSKARFQKYMNFQIVHNLSGNWNIKKIPWKKHIKNILKKQSENILKKKAQKNCPFSRRAKSVYSVMEIIVCILALPVQVFYRYVLACGKNKTTFPLTLDRQKSQCLS